MYSVRTNTPYARNVASPTCLNLAITDKQPNVLETKLTVMHISEQGDLLLEEGISSELRGAICE